MSPIPIRLYTDKTIEAFRGTIRELFFGADRALTKRYLQLFLKQIIINLPKVELFGKTENLLAVLNIEKP